MSDTHISRRLSHRWFCSLALVIATVITVSFTWNTSEAQTTPAVSSLSNFGVFGINRVTIQKSSIVNSGYIGTYKQVILMDELSIAPASYVFAPNLEIRGSTVVQTAFFNALNNRRRVVSAYAFPLTPLLTLPAIPVVTPSTQDVWVAASATHTLAQGSYNTLTVLDGGTVVFTGGLYHFSNITLNRNVRLSFAAPTEIRVANRFFADSRTHIEPLSGTSVTAAQILIGVYGVNVSETENPAVVELDGHHTIAANFYVPHGQIDVGVDSQITGSLIANWVYIDVESEITLASSYTNIIAPVPTPVPPATG
jgi:hypothetical protein